MSKGLVFGRGPGGARGGVFGASNECAVSCSGCVCIEKFHQTSRTRRICVLYCMYVINKIVDLKTRRGLHEVIY